MIDSANLMPYDSSPTTTTQRPAMSTQFMVENGYTVAPMTSPQLSQYPADNNFVYAQYAPQTPPTLSGSFKHYPEDYPPRPMTTDTESAHAVYQREHSPTHLVEQDTRPQIKYEPQVTSQRSFSPSPSAAFKTVQRNVAEDKTNEIEFSTNVDILMKAIQLKDDNQEGSDSGETAYPSPPHIDEEKFNLRRKSCSPESATGSQSGKDRQKRYVCDVKGCNKRCTQKTQLETHKRAHTGEKPYVGTLSQASLVTATDRLLIQMCPELGCGRRFTQRGNLKTHIRSHTGERPYSCDLCGQTFAQRGNVKPHRLTHFKAKPFPCNLDGCEKTFGQRGNLKTHHNHFHAETLRDLTVRFSNLPPGSKLSEEDQKLFNYFAELYKNSNKGIKGRGKDKDKHRRDGPKHRGSTTPSVSHYSVQPSVQHHIYPHPRLHTQHGLPYPDELANYGMSRNGSQHVPYGMYDMDQASITSSDTATASSSPVTIYEEDHGRTMLPQHRIY
ncbi:hypothetical protein F4818DRAFT_366881 [Hypoxylon cercidicola]|nr:hypothetical protein F4818DRAFT_366881 [Hypoxylon cercidicola]